MRNRTFKAIKILINKRYLYALVLIVFIVVIVCSSYFVRSINEDIQDALLTILSIVFPLIAGFLTFGRDLLKAITDKIKDVIEKDEKDIGEPMTITNKKKIRRLKDLSEQFTEVIISTFIFAFILIVGLLIAKFNDFEFTTKALSEPFKNYLCQNATSLFAKIVFFFCLFTMLLNTFFLTSFIIKINSDREII